MVEVNEQIRPIHCEACGRRIAFVEYPENRWVWTDLGAGVSEISERELCGDCLESEDEAGAIA